jgi:hypothetical protein
MRAFALGSAVVLACLSTWPAAPITLAQTNNNVRPPYRPTVVAPRPVMAMPAQPRQQTRSATPNGTAMPGYSQPLPYQRRGFPAATSDVREFPGMNGPTTASGRERTAASASARRRSSPSTPAADNAATSNPFASNPFVSVPAAANSSANPFTPLSGSARAAGSSFFVPFYSRALKFTLAWEGGYVNNPHDKGGPTNEGITQATYNAFRKVEGLKPQSVKNISSEELNSMYRSIWRQSGADELPWPLSLVQFDTAVESPRLAKTLLARVEGKHQSPTEAAIEYVKLRMQWRLDDVKDDPTQSVFLKGWQNRDDALLAHVNQAAEGPLDVTGGPK